MLLKTKATKVIALLCILALAITAIIPSGFVMSKAWAAAASGKEEWDFTKGTLVTSETNGAVDFVSGNLTIKAVSSSTFALNGDASHGVVVSGDHTIEVVVPGPTKLTVGDCQWGAAEVTVSAKNNGYKETKTGKTGCYHQGATLSFTYTGEATTLVISFSGSSYVPYVSAEPIVPEVEPEAGKTYKWDFTDGSVVPTTANNAKTEISADGGILKILPGTGSYRYNDASHGVEFGAGLSFEIKVAGSTKLIVGDCQHSTQTDVTVKDKNGTYTATKKSKTGCYDGKGTGELVFEYKGEATTLVVTLGDKIYIHAIIAEPIEDKSEEEKPEERPDDPTKIDVWDFGGKQLDTATYINKLNADIINSWYPEGTVAGSTGVSMNTSFGDDEMSFVTPSNKTGHRIRTSNTAITRYDANSCPKTFADGQVLEGWLYSNSGSTSEVYLEIELFEGDILTVYANANKTDSTLCLVPPSGGEPKKQVAKQSGDIVKFYASEYGKYKLYSEDEKLYVWRLLREHTNPVTVSGSVTAPSSINSGYKISFTNQKSGAVKEATVINGSYSVKLYDNYTYDLSLVDANGYIISAPKTLEVPKGSADITNANITIEQVALTEVTITISGIDDAETLKNLELEFVNESASYIPEVKKTADGSYTVKLEDGVTYDVVASGKGINDYDLTTTTLSETGGTSQTIAFSKKSVYGVTVSYKDLPAEAQAKATLVFTNIEDGYVYTFNPGDTIQLRNGQYSVVVKNTGVAPVVQKLTSDLKVEGAPATKEIAFEPISEWDFSKYNTTAEAGGNPGMDADGAHYLGLKISGASENKTYLLVSSGGEVNVPVTKGQLVAITYCYKAGFEINGKPYTTENSTGSTTKTDVVRVTAEDDGYLTIKVTSETYFNSISVTTAVEAKNRITVGVDKDYQTINDALAAVAKMDRPNNERVEIVIDPGDYEEMLVISVPNVSLINAAGKNSSLDIINKGVDIGDNVVRITSYYGTGYNYYSMGPDCKWHADILAANKANGSFTTANPGDGTTNGSYWNATVVVKANGFEANGIVFENSFNQYISKKAAEDIVVKTSKAKEPQNGPARADLPAGDTSVQDKDYVERAAALAIAADKSVFINCKFIGRQDTLYGDKNVKAAFHECDILGGTDYIFGGMIAVFYKCNLVMNTSDTNKNDVAYITAPQQDSGRGYLMYECTITSTTPNVDTASTMRSKPGYFGRPWKANTSEVVFFRTTIKTTNHTSASGQSLILPAGWLSSLGGESPYMYEYGTIELSGEDNSASRANWAAYLTKPVLADGTEINIKAFLGSWAEELQARKLLLETESEPDPEDPEDPEEPNPEDPEDPNAPEDPDVIERETNNVEVVLPKDALPEGVDPEEVKFSAEVLKSSGNEVLYDLKFLDKNGIEIHIDGTVTVRLPLPESFVSASKIYVYYVDDNGGYTKMKATVDKEKMIVEFRTTHFSHYLLTTEVKGSSPSPDTDDDDASDSSSPTSPNNPYTGVEPVIPVAAVIFVGGIAAVIFAFIKRRKAK
ncbi:MAG: hypothetical protein J1F28_09500 [Oscillospiraceae bacterium]|nr:hypothetical protein [Oscillospiraceae bacterium]